MKPVTSQRRGIQSLEIGIRLFQDVHRLGRPVTLSELAHRSKMPASKVHRYCVSLIRTGLLHQDGRGLYSIGSYGFQLSHAEAEVDHARALALAALPDLVSETNETVFLSEWGEAGPRILRVVDPARPISIRPTTTGEIPVLLSATGRVFAAFMDVVRVTTLIDAEIIRLCHEQTLSAREARMRKQAFLRQLPDVRRRGIARTTGERYRGLVSFAVPIFDPRGRVILALTAFGLATTFPSAWDAAVPRALLRCASDLTRRIGGRKP